MDEDHVHIAKNLNYALEDAYGVQYLGVLHIPIAKKKEHRITQESHF